MAVTGHELGFLGMRNYLARRPRRIRIVQHNLWLGSDHDRAMQLANDQTVLANFNNTSFTYQGVTTRFFRVPRGGQAHFAPKTPQNEPVPYAAQMARITCQRTAGLALRARDP